MSVMCDVLLLVSCIWSILLVCCRITQMNWGHC